MAAMTSTERTQRWRARQRAGEALSGPWLFPELAPVRPPAPPPPEPKTTPAQRAASRKSSRRHNERKRIEREAVALAPPCDPDRPDVPGLIAWLESRLQVSQGRRAGEAFEALPWQREFLAAALAPGKFDAALSMARGNGKSTFLAAVIAAAIAPNGPLRQPRGEVLLVASSFQQARVVFEHLRFFLEPFIAAPRARLENRGFEPARRHHSQVDRRASALHRERPAPGAWLGTLFLRLG